MQGSYVLVTQLFENCKIEIGSIGVVNFEKGWYAYVGSGLNYLDKRIQRHLRDGKNLHWHIDYFLTKGEIEEVLYGEGEKRKECDIANLLAEDFPVIEDFGSSDCKCEGHLFYSEDISKLRNKITSSFRTVGLKPERW